MNVMLMLSLACLASLPCSLDAANGNTRHVVFLGTGAADISTPESCNCENCRYIRENGGSNWRRFSSLFVSPDIVIDYSSTGHKSLSECGISPASINHLLITHSHADHCDPASILELAEERAKSIEGSLHIYGNASSISKIRDFLTESKNTNQSISLVEIAPYQNFAAGDWTVKPLPANHDSSEDCLLYLLKTEDKALFYGTDTTWFPSGTFGALANEKLDLAIVECTFCQLDDAYYLTGHMNLTFNKLIREYFTSRNILKPEGKFYLTHLSLHWCDPHDKVSDKTAKHGLLVPHDGQRIDI